MTKTFKIGDIVEANEFSNGEYSFTRQDRASRGEVFSVEGSFFGARTTDGEGSCPNESYRSLEPKFFDLVTPVQQDKQSIEIIEGLTVELTPEQLEEVSRKLQSAKDKAKKAPTEAVRRATVGDIVVITGNSSSSNHIGDTGKIIEDAHDHQPYRVDVPGRAKLGIWEHEHNVRLATAEEINQYEVSLRSKPEVGDWVRIIKDNDSDLTIGKAYKVMAVEDTWVTVNDDVGEENGISAGDYEIVEDVTPFDRAGRQPNEFIKGDIVRVTSGYDTIEAGDIGFVVKAEPDGSHLVSAGGKRYYVQCELIAPVESRVDEVL